MWKLLLQHASWKNLVGSVDDDWVDRMSHKWTVSILVLFAIVVTSAQFVGQPIHCWCPAEFKKWYVRYTHNYCWVANTYHVPMSDVIPGNDEPRADISYYQWVPLILLVQALFFKLPCVLWHMSNSSSGINLPKLCRMVDTMQMESKDERAKTIRNITEYFDKCLIRHRGYRNDSITKQNTPGVGFYQFSQRQGFYLSGLYLFVKVLYFANCIFQFWALSEFLSLDFLQYVADNFKCILGDCSGVERSPRFPRVTLCDYKIRQMQNIQSYTVQCVLPINLFNEKIFVFILTWIIITGALSSIKLLSWLGFMLKPRSRQIFIRKFIADKLDNKTDKVLLRTFADQYLRTDGCFLLRIVKSNTSDVTVTDLVTYMWHNYKGKIGKSLTNETDPSNSREVVVLYQRTFCCAKTIISIANRLEPDQTPGNPASD